MRIEPRTYTLKNGKTVLIRNAETADAAAVIEEMRLTSAQTYFLCRTAEEVASVSVEGEKTFLTNINADPAELFIVAECDGELVGTAGLNRVSPRVKLKHRATVGISIIEAFCSCGLGSIMLNTLTDGARAVGYEQVELGVFEDNVRGIALYRKLGFVPWGKQPHAFKLPDGTYRDEIQMTLFLEGRK